MPRGSYIIFCGNPGAGKSTLLSSISGMQFDSGLSWGRGLTAELRFQESPLMPGLKFGDTPGLSDIKLAEEASKAITQALLTAAKENANVKIFFVVTVESGRIRTDDLYTIKQVMGSITLPDGSKPGPNNYGLIINKCDFLDRPDFQSQGLRILMNEVAQPESPTSVPFTTVCLKFLPQIPEMANASNKMLKLPELMEFVLTFPGIEIARADKIDVSDLEEKLRKAKEDNAREMANLEKKLKEGHKSEMDVLQQNMNSIKRDMQEKLDAAERKARASGGGAMGAVVDVAAIFAKPICKAIRPDDPDLENNFLDVVGKLKQCCFV